MLLKIMDKLYTFIPAVVLSLVFVSSEAQSKPSWVYYSGAELRAGAYHFDESGSWTGSRAETMNQDLFFRGDPFDAAADRAYYSDNVNTELVGDRKVKSKITFEWQIGVSLYKLPLLGFDFLKDFNNIRIGMALDYYPMSTIDSTLYNGPVVYTNTKAISPDPSEVTYNSLIKMKERYYMIVPSFGIYYAYEKGWGNGTTQLDAVPYFGVQIGSAMLNGERKITMISDPYQSPDGSVRQVNASIQETFFRQYGVRYGAAAGVYFHVAASHFIDLRVEYFYQESEVSLTRSGSWNETIDGTQYSKKVSSESGSAVISQTGFAVTLGYSVRVL